MRVPEPLPASVQATRARVVGLPATGATLGWLQILPLFGATTPSLPDPEPSDVARIDDTLSATVALDPSFDDPWLGGALMLRVLDGDDGPRTTRLVREGRRLRPDLPWDRIAPEVR